MQRLQEEYRTMGVRRSVEAVILVEKHGHPHVLTLQIGGSYFKLYSSMHSLSVDILLHSIDRAINYLQAKIRLKV